MTEKKGRGVFAALDEAAVTIVPTANEYVPIAGVFLNSPLAAFSVVDDPGIKYENHTAIWFEVDWHASVSAHRNNTTVHIGLNKNGLLDPRSVMGQVLTLLNQPQGLSGTCAIHIKPGDVIQLAVTADGDGDEITFHHFTTKIREFHG